MSDGILDKRGKALVDEFFQKKEAETIAKYKGRLASEKSRAELAQASCVSDEGVLDRLVELGLTADTVAAIALAPLVHVAWADGKIQDAERSAILKAAEQKGIQADGPSRALLDEWLKEGGHIGLFEVWSSYVGALCGNLTSDQVATLRTQIHDHARAVAEAAGGILGIGSVAKAEGRALAEIESAFQTQKAD